MTARITLFNYWRSSCSHRIRIALALKELDYEYVAVDLSSDEQLGEAYRSHSPTGYVPCLVYDGLAYVESVSILELLEERHPAPPLYPSDLHGRARVRALVEMVNSGIQPLQNRNVVQYVSPDPTEQGRWLKHFVGRGLTALEAALLTNAREGVSGRYAFGSTPTAADVFLVPQVVVAKRIGLDLGALERVRVAYDAAMEIQAFQRAAPENQPDAARG
jgi:maleylpyruvate isomerase